MKSKNNHHHSNIFFISLLLIAIGLPLQPYLTSLAQAILLVNWLIEGRFHHKFHKLKINKGLILWLSFYIIHAIWLISTSDMQEGVFNLQKKATLFILPLIIGTSEELNHKKFILILKVFISAIIVSSIACTIELMSTEVYEIIDYRDLSLFISHSVFSVTLSFLEDSLFFLQSSQCL